MNNFDLDGAIALWRERLSWRDAFTDADLDEMESHLRDEVESLVRSGMGEQKAFYQTVRTFDDDMKLAWRFNQANWENVMSKRTRYAPTLIGNYFKVAIRNLFRHKLYSIINIAGLAVGIACSLLIFLFVRNELTYDRHHTKADRIYRISQEWHYENGDIKSYANSSVKLAPTLLEETPDIEHAARFLKASVYIKNNDRRFYEDNGYYADASALDIFSFLFIEGDPNTALRAPHTIVITKEMAQKYFQDQNPIGQILIVQDTIHAKVTGVLAPLPTNSHFTFDFLLSFQTLESINHPTVRRWAKYWGNHGPYTYVLLRQSASPEQVASQVLRLTKKHAPEEEKRFKVSYMQRTTALTDIYLRSNFLYEIGEASNTETVYLFSGVAILILFMACINFMNLATARSINRAQEVGMRKVVGAHRRQLITQFLGEAFLMTCLAVGLSIILITLVLTPFNDLSGKMLSLDIFQDATIVLGLFVITLCVGLIAGSYPAFALSQFQPIDVLKGVLKNSRKGAKIRQGLVVFQFAISVVLIISTVVVINQLDHMRQQNLGFDTTQIITIPFHDNPDLKKRYDGIKSALLNHPHIKNASASDTVPGQPYGDMKFLFTDKDGESLKTTLYQHVDTDFIETFDLKLIAGRGFSKDFPSDLEHGYVLNETAVSYLGLGTPQEALGKQVDANANSRLIGVVQNFHHYGLQRAIDPLLIKMRPHRFQYLSVKIQTIDISETLNALEKIWQTQVPNRPFEYTFLDADFEKQYQTERRLSQIFTTFATLAIFIGCLGLFGLVSFAAQQRTREIGIRKILGAPVSNIVALLSKDFLKLILIANLIAWPIAYYAMQKWLETFAFRTSLGISTFIFSGLFALLIALFTIGYQAIKAAHANPVDSLRYE